MSRLSTAEPYFDPEKLRQLAHAKMPFGKYKNRFLTDLPEAYLIWFQQKGWPAGSLGVMLEEMLGIKTNGLESLLRTIRSQSV